MTIENSRADALTDLSDDELALIREEAARITDDWCERQLMAPSRKESDAKFVREVLRLAAPPVEQPRTHTTQPGESVAGIALRQCGNENEWRNIIALNPEFSEHTACDYFPVGTVLTLPPRPVEQPAAAPIDDDDSPAIALAMVDPCPFCGSENVDPKGWLANDGRSGPACDDCGATAESVEGWNRRAPAPSPTDERAAFDSEVGSVIADAATRGIAWMSFKAGIAYARAARTGASS